MNPKLLASAAAAIAAIGAAAVNMAPIAMASTGPARIQGPITPYAQNPDGDEDREDRYEEFRRATAAGREAAAARREADDAAADRDYDAANQAAISSNPQRDAAFREGTNTANGDVDEGIVHETDADSDAETADDDTALIQRMFETLYSEYRRPDDPLLALGEAHHFDSVALDSDSEDPAAGYGPNTNTANWDSSDDSDDSDDDFPPPPRRDLDGADWIR